MSTIVDVDPRDLVVAENVRKDTKLTKEFVASVREHGVLVPVLVQEGLQGYEVLDGQRRTLAAVEAGVASVPAVIVPAIAKDSERIVDQLVVNEHREYLTASEHIAAVKQLELFGMPASAIAKKTGAKKADVEKAIVVGGSEFGVQLIEAQIGLDHAAAILEFEEDPEIVERLTSIAVERPGSFEHYLQDARQQKAADERRVHLVAELTGKGYRVLDEEPDYTARASIAQTGYLYSDPEMKQLVRGEALEPTAPGLVVALRRDWVRVAEETDESDGYVLGWAPVFYIEDWQTLGYFSRSASDGGPGGAPRTEKSGKDIERERAERRRVIANNKAWPAATRVRVAWITETLLKARKLPATAQTLIALKQASDLPKDSYSSGVSEALDWLGAEKTTFKDKASRAVRYLEQHPQFAERLNLAIALASVELGLKDKSSWRYYEQPKLVRYLELLASSGYGLSELEQSLVDAK